MNLSKSISAFLWICFLLISRTIFSRSKRPSITVSTGLGSGHLSIICLFLKKSIYFRIGQVPSTNGSTKVDLSSLSTSFLSASREASLSPPASVKMYFLREDVRTRVWMFCISTSSSSLQALFNYLCVLSILFLTWENFWRVHFETSMSVFILSRACASRRAIVRPNFSLN